LNVCEKQQSWNVFCSYILLFIALQKQQNPPHSMRRVLFEVWVSLGFWLSFEIDCSLPAFDFYEGADPHYGTASDKKMATDS